MNARFAGTCALTGRRYAEGAVIRRTDVGWALDDTTTDTALAEAKSATIRLRGGSGSGCEGWVAGEVVRHEGEVVVIVTATRQWYSDDGLCFGAGEDRGFLFEATARPATAVEAGPLLARETAEQELREVHDARRRAESTLLALPRTQVNTVPDGAAAHCWLTRQQYTGYIYSPPRWDAHVFTNGEVYLSCYDPDSSRDNVWLVDASTGVHPVPLARTAAWRIFENGCCVADRDTDDPLTYRLGAA